MQLVFANCWAFEKLPHGSRKMDSMGKALIRPQYSTRKILFQGKIAGISDVFPIIYKMKFFGRRGLTRRRGVLY